MDNDNGTVSPTAALASMPYTPEESMKALKYFYRERGEDLFGIYGPYDAFNDELDWVNESYIGIDQGPIVVMIENYRTGLLWDQVMNDPDVKSGLTKLGFQYSTLGYHQAEQSFAVYPNPVKNAAFFSIPAYQGDEPLTLTVYTLDGRRVKTRGFNNAAFSLDCSDLQDGLYLIRLGNGNMDLQGKLLIKK